MPPRAQLASLIMDHVMILHQNPPEGVTEAELAMLLATAELVVKKPPDAKWLYQTMHILNEDHEIFHPQYRNVKQNKKVSINNMPYFNNDDGFFDNAQPRDSKGKKQRLMRIPKSEKLRMQKEVYKAKLSEMTKRLNQVDEEIKAEIAKRD